MRRHGNHQRFKRKRGQSQCISLYMNIYCVILLKKVTLVRPKMHHVYEYLLES